MERNDLKFRDPKEIYEMIDTLITRIGPKELADYLFNNDREYAWNLNDALGFEFLNEGLVEEDLYAELMEDFDDLEELIHRQFQALSDGTD